MTAFAVIHKRRTGLVQSLLCIAAALAAAQGRGAGSDRGKFAPDLEGRWADLAESDGAAAHKAIWALVARGDDAVALLAPRLKRIARGHAARVETLLRDLDSKKFAEREAAFAALAKLGGLAAPALRKALEGGPTEEVRRRVARLLAALDDSLPLLAAAGEPLRGVRGVEVLERIASPAARQALRDLAAGPASSLTEHAHDALLRLGDPAGGDGP